MKKITLIVAACFISTCSIAQTISAGAFFSAAVCTDNTVRTWGWNVSGELGNNTFTDSPVPVQVFGLTAVIKIASGGSHTLALKNDGTVWSWGGNSSGELGNNTTADSPVPVQVTGLSDVVSISCGESSSFAIKRDGTVWAWGYNGNGILGDSSNTNRLTPVQVHNLAGIIQVDAGSFHALALKIDGTVWAWGYNYGGQSGNADTNGVEHWVPVQSSITDVRMISCGSYFCLALRSDSIVWGWGEGSTFGALGDSVYSYYGDAYLPVQVGISSVTLLGDGADHSMAIKNDSTAWGWGFNGQGQLGNGTTITSPFPAQMIGLSGVVDVASEAWHSTALKSDGSLWAFGSNNNGELGNGTTSTGANPTPGQVIGLCSVLIPPTNCTSNFTLTPDTSQLHTYFIVSNTNGTPPIRHLWSWGDNTYDTIPYPSHTYSDTGFYNICHAVFDGVGCSSVYCYGSSLLFMPLQIVTVNVVTSLPTGINDDEFFNLVSIYPNPATNELRIQSQGFGTELRIESVEVFDVLGQKIKDLTPSPRLASPSSGVTSTSGEGSASIDVSKLAPGIYFVKVRTEKEERVAKFVKQ